ncbi:hypothetical protein BGZ60DRAFT_389605 [Tricladium varicosporioides]|nr:hypothetical protein BGZ60DRAFT_389605 [Hymenoscyphus varicosporioides]
MRPAKRVRQACEPCRRKKSRCPGEKPVCSHCSRLRQNCFYAEDRQESDQPIRNLSPVRQPCPLTTSDNDRRLEERLRSVESQLAEVLAHQRSESRSSSLQISESPVRPHHYSRSERSPRSSNDALPAWDVIFTAAQAYLRFCDCQPLPLFHHQSFLQTLQQRDDEILLSVLGLATRFCGDLPLYLGQSQTRLADGHVRAARGIVFKKVLDGTVELSTIQSLCLLSLVDFTNGNTRRASTDSSLAISLAHNAGLMTESSAAISPQDKEERRRCFWSLYLLKRLHGADFMVLDFATEDNFPQFPESNTDVIDAGRPSANKMQKQSINNKDQGIISYAIQLSDVWFKITRYAWRRGKPSNTPPWSLDSEYSTIMAQQMDFETRMPYAYRFKPAKFSQQSLDELNSSRDFWGPWLLVQFLYHTNLCLLNHPLLLSLRLRNFKCVIPEIFLQHTSELISSHTSWVMNFIDMLETKQFVVTDPFLGHCVAIIATIYLQQSFVEDPLIQRESREKFDRCLGFIRSFGAQWPHVGRIAEKLEGLRVTVSSTQVASDEPTRQNRKLLIDLGQFFEVLEYSSSSEVPGSAKSLFGSSLDAIVRTSRSEMSQTSVLPEPTRVERQEFGSANATPTMNQENIDMAMNFGAGSASVNATPLQFSDDELAVLAENFFHQRLEFDGNANWWHMGNL